MLPREVLLGKIEETVALGGDQILLQGGLHPKFNWTGTKRCCTTSNVHFRRSTFTVSARPKFITSRRSTTVRWKKSFRRLKDAGLGSLPGGGAEILVDRVRSEITRGKVMTDDWLNVMRVWHQLGRTQQRHDDVRSCRNAGRANRASGAAATAAGRNGWLHGLHLLDVSARQHRHGPCFRRPDRSSI